MWQRERRRTSLAASSSKSNNTPGVESCVGVKRKGTEECLKTVALLLVNGRLVAGLHTATHNGKYGTV